MPGTAKTNKFMLNTATVMLGAQEDLYDLTAAAHSIGLVKNFTITAEPSYTELTQGQKNTIVHSTLTANPVRATMEAYEYTSKNIGYALGLEGAEDLAAQSVATTTVGAGSPDDVSVVVTSATGITTGKYIMIIANTDDEIHIRKVTNVVSTTLTVDQALPVIPAGSAVKVVNLIEGGSKEEQPYYAAKIVGKLADGDPIVLYLPKVRIVKGFSLAFTTDNYGNLPLELTSYDQVATDPFYAAFAGAQFHLFAQN